MLCDSLYAAHLPIHCIGETRLRSIIKNAHIGYLLNFTHWEASDRLAAGKGEKPTQTGRWSCTVVV